MAAYSFHATGTGPDAQTVFDQMVAASPGRNIGTKTRFTTIPLPDGVYEDDRREVADAADMLIAAEDPRIADRNGPVGCFEIGPVEGLPAGHELFLFFGWTNSLD